jgi:ABC-type xylose transport system permease subunit
MRGVVGTARSPLVGVLAMASPDNGMWMIDVDIVSGATMPGIDA